jgi:hypothetical protein
LSPQNLCVEILTSKMMALGGEPLGDDWLGHEGFASVNEISSLKI